jgi:tetratricopeptide (TPR) repeat protein
MPDEAPRQRPRWRTAAEVLVLAAAVAGCYSNSLGAPFVLDDERSLTLDPGLASWAPSPVEPPSRRVAYLSFKVDYRLHGLDPAGFHATNVAVHVLAALAVYALARLLLSRAGRGAARGERADAVAPAAFAAALLWAVHPVQTQAVTYVVQRIASLAALFYVAALALYLAAREGRGASRALAYAAALAAGLLAMFTKEIAFTLPLAIVLAEVLFLEGPRLRRLAAVAPFLALLPIVPWTYLAPHRAAEGLLRGGDAAARLGGLSRLDYLATEARVLVTYLRLLVLPVGQNLDYDYPVEHGLGSPPVLLSGALLLALLAAGAWLARRRATGARVAGFGVVLFFLALSVESSVIPIADVIFEHRLYLPSVGAALAVGALLAEVTARRPAAAPRAWAAVAAAALALGAATFARNRVWRDPVTLWRDVAEKSPNKARGHYNLGNALREAGDLAGAEREWMRAVEIAPLHSGAENQLGSLALVRGDLPSAEAHLRRALAPPWAVPDANYNLALVLEAMGRSSEALPFYRAFVERAPPDRAEAVAEVRARFGWR